MENDPAFRPLAYFSMEVGLKESIPTYSGGLGVLAGDILKSAADLSVPMAGVTLLYRKGYFVQEFNDDGWQKEKPVQWNPAHELRLLPNRVSITLQGREIQIGVWVYEIIGATGYPLPVYFLDTDFEPNNPEDRKFCWYLYGGDNNYRLCQEFILGVGGLRMLRDLGYMNIETFHLNEGHAGFLTLELMREQGYYDPDKIREQVVFTTHTPVPAGHDYFEFGLIDRAFPPDALSTIKRMMPDLPGVSMTELGLRYSRYVNGVAKKHAEVSNAMFKMETVDWITNGVHPTTWVSSGMRRLYNKHIPGWEQDPGRLVQALTIPKEELWAAHQAAKLRLFARVLETTGSQLDPEILTLGFARRAATYKRADLLFSDLKRFMEVVGDRKVQFIFAGKAHPHDNGGKAVLQKIKKTTKELEDKVSIVFIDNYNMEIASLLTQGVDLWLNTPMRPREASGTSGMKCTLNGIMNFSVLDGWWIEGWIEDVTGWSIGPEPSAADYDRRYDESLDAIDLYNKLEQKIIPTYYNNHEKWVSMMQHTIALNASFFNTHRVVREYASKAYFIDFRGM
ncbi:MAG: alpha-glucan family phosphorylase [Synergistaceae bacterium]|jgi:starch phosphorylase|nr:alpha-glucan family phosphorylase [Synergistaceae bacterium]